MPAKLIQPYLFFNGRCEEAAEFYTRTLGAEVTMKMRFKESPEPSHNPPGSEEKIMHLSMKIGESIVMASDGRCSGKTNFEGFCLSIVAADAAEARRLFDALAEGGNVEMPLEKTFWSPLFGMVEDQFGVGWMVNVVP